ncbi:MAG: DUF6402 family protein [Azoarcus sp.]|nr:DUF6402 family protein [Azoarcus sp.]
MNFFKNYGDFVEVRNDDFRHWQSKKNEGEDFLYS